MSSCAHKLTRKLTLNVLLIHQLGALRSDQQPKGFRLAGAQDGDRVKDRSESSEGRGSEAWPAEACGVRR